MRELQQSDIIETPVPQRGRTNQMTYLQVMGRDAGSSSRRELVDSSRKLLFANISILEKQKESEVFRGDLLAETERVRDARINFDLNTERY